jgi:pimeloyl-ACP methyl ester carboxylesterase
MFRMTPSILLTVFNLFLAVAASSAKDAGSSTLSWTGCPSPAPSHFQCAILTAPLYYDQPEDQTVKLNVVRVPATNPTKRLGSWIFQEGGPGIPTSSDLIGLAGAVGWQTLQQQYDLVALDPRGVGANYPIVCDPKMVDNVTASLTSYPKKEADWSQTIDAWGAIGNECKRLTAEAYGLDIWSTVDTLTSAKDLETLRLALDEGGINYYGVSWGEHDSNHG